VARVVEIEESFRAVVLLALNAKVAGRSSESNLVTQKRVADVDWLVGDGVCAYTEATPLIFNDADHWQPSDWQKRIAR
jgi:hypothetical protein